MEVGGLGEEWKLSQENIVQEREHPGLDEDGGWWQQDGKKWVYWGCGQI